MFTKPELHDPIPMESRVQVDAEVYSTRPTGTVIGVAGMHIIFVYIVLLDEPMMMDDEQVRGIVAPGSLLTVLPPL